MCIGNPREITSRYAGYLVFTLTVGNGHEEAAQVGPPLAETAQWNSPCTARGGR